MYPRPENWYALELKEGRGLPWFHLSLLGAAFSVLELMRISSSVVHMRLPGKGA